MTKNRTKALLDGWCSIGSTVYSDFYISEASKPRTISKIHLWENGHATVSTEKGFGIRALSNVDFDTWIKQKPDTN